MSSTIIAKLAELGLTLPEAAAPVAAYVPTVEAGGLLHVSGQLPFVDGALMTGRCGEDRDEAYGRQAAERCGLMLLAQVKAALGSLDRVARVVKLGVFVNSAGDFTAQPRVANGASELMVAMRGAQSAYRCCHWARSAKWTRSSPSRADERYRREDRRRDRRHRCGAVGCLRRC